jgi:hypothetical protein
MHFLSYSGKTSKICNTYNSRCSATSAFDTELLSNLGFSFQLLVLEKVTKSLWVLFLTEISYWYFNKTYASQKNQNYTLYGEIRLILY